MRKVSKVSCLILLLLSLATLGWSQVMKVPGKLIGPQMQQIHPSIRSVQMVHSQVALQPLETQQIENATKLMVQQQFSQIVGQSESVTPRVTVLGRLGNRIQAEALVVFLAKNTYTATISKLDYEVEGANVTLKQKIDNFAPRVEPVRAAAPPSPVLMQIKKDLLVNLQLQLPQGTGPKAMANTPCTNFPSAVNYTNSVAATFAQAFGAVEKKIGAQSTKAAVLDVLKNSTRLLAWNNIGHGNPSLIVQWNDDPIWHTDFNPSTNFSGVYNAVILLNSCQTCANPFSLRNAIKQHHPRTLIAGNVNLPVGTSERVDDDFWKMTLLQGQTMANALAIAQQNHGLTGYFCLDGYNDKFAEVEAQKFTEDCLPFNPNQISAQLVQGHWKVTEGAHWLLDFGSNQANAQKAANIIKHYQMDKICFVGRPNPGMTYFTVKGSAPQGPFPGEDAIPFNPANVTAASISGSWKVVDGGHSLLDFGNREAQAKIAVEIIKFYGFTHICFVGRPQPGMVYFRK